MFHGSSTVAIFSGPSTEYRLMLLCVAIALCSCFSHKCCILIASYCMVKIALTYYTYISLGNFLTECVTTAVIGYQCIDSITYGNQVNYQQDENMLNFTQVESRKMLLCYLMKHFCCPEGTVLEDTKSGGIYIFT